jgi:hypothetical protein
MNEEMFKRVLVTIDHKGHRGLAVVCGKCGATHAERFNSIAHPGDNEEFKLAKKRFETRGWTVGKRRCDDRCPKCAAAARDVSSTTRLIIAPQAKAESPTDFQHRALILTKLIEVYDVDKHKYRESWTDQRVAKDLGSTVDMALVRRLRSENFGPSGSNGELDERLDKASVILAEAKGLAERAREQADAAEAACGAAAAAIAAIKRELLGP